jgi:hypothetical protein
MDFYLTGSRFSFIAVQSGQFLIDAKRRAASCENGDWIQAVQSFAGNEKIRNRNSI